MGLTEKGYAYLSVNSHNAQYSTLSTATKMLEVKCQKNFKINNFSCRDKRYKENHSAENRDKKTQQILSIQKLGYLIQKLLQYMNCFPYFFKIFNHDALSCDVTDDYNLYIYISNFKGKLS